MGERRVLEIFLTYVPVILMNIRNAAAIVGIGETPTHRLGSKPGESSAEYIGR
jgi:hypothetical protein